MFKPVNSNENFPEMEKKWLSNWYNKGVVDKYLKKNSPLSKRFSYLDGPITANNPMGVHHAWGRTYKDLFPRFFNLLGYRQRFQNGFDCQGLWVEVEVEKELRLKSKKDIENLVPGDPKASVAKFVGLCKERVKKYSKIQTEQSKRLGYFADWDHSYFTMSDENNYMIWLFLKKCFDNGWIYKGHESVPWCPRCETAISQHEMLTEDYKEIVHESVYFELKILNPKFQVPNKSQISNNKFQNTYLLVWTTTPWTIPANIAVAINKDYDYSLAEGTSGELFWVAKDLIGAVFGKDYKRIVKTVKGKELVGLHYQGPFDDLPAVSEVAKNYPEKFHSIIATDDLILPISLTEGTGLVHTAVSAGVEDFKLGKKYGLPMIPVIADNADYLPGLGFLSGKNAKKHPEIILNYLREKDVVFKTHHYKHRYPACWRCKTELVWKVEDEWYIAMDVSPSQVQSSKFKVQNRKQNTKTLRQRMMGVAKKIKWVPGFGLERELDWLKNMHDWLISKKNRYWGLALPIYECKKCRHFEVLGSKEELKEKAIDGWKEFEGHTPHKPFIDEVLIKCSKCGEAVKRINDVGNPWLDAGIVPYSTITKNNQGQPLYLTNRKEWQQWFPADLISESFPGQFKNWFYAMIAMSAVLENTNPYKTVIGYATLTGEDGRPMHKSWGNMIEFNQAADKIGVDVMRWLFCRQDMMENLLFGYKKADEVRRQFYLMLWNIYKFFVEYSNLDKSEIRNPKSETNPKSKNILDQWIKSRFIFLSEYVKEKLLAYNVKDAAIEIEKFVSDLSTWYIRRSRGRVWVNSDDELDKENFYQTTYYILVNLSIILSPFLPFISEEIYTNLTAKESVHLDFWPETNENIDTSLIKEMAVIRQIVEIGHRVRKELQLKVRQPLAEVKIELPVKLKGDLTKLIASELNVKKVILKTNKKIEQLKVVFDTRLSAQLKKEGELRELVRLIQAKRKEMGAHLDQPINLTIPEQFSEYRTYLRKKVICRKITIGGSLKITL